MELVIRSPAVRQLVEEYRKIWALGYASALLGWDYETYMPPGAAEERGEAEAVLVSLRRSFYTSERFLSLLERAGREAETDLERGIVRVLRRDVHYYTSIPEELLQERERAVNRAKLAWRRAKKRSDFSIFAPHLERLVDIARRMAERLGYEKTPYNALLDLYEEGLTVDDVEGVFSVIVPPLRRLVRRDPPHPLEDLSYERNSMERLNREVLTRMGFDWNHMRLDESAHPFTEGIGLYDVRITTWYHGKDFRRSLLAAIHEFGHALYDAGSDPALWATPVQGGVSLGVHESQSRFWENVVARSRPFVRFLLPLLHEHLPETRKFGEDDVYAYFTLVRPSLIRVEADEVTYNLHIVLRYRIERSLIEGTLEPSEVPAAWNEEMENLLGVRPENDAEGCLQDIHWAMGSFGYFPTYTLGNVYAAQILRALERDVDVWSHVESGEFSPILSWLRERIHRWGAVYPPKSLMEKATGKPIDPSALVSYLKEKYGKG